MTPARVRPLSSTGDASYGFSVWCPGCEDYHVLRGWRFNGDLVSPTFEPSLLVSYKDERGAVEVGRCHSYIRDGRIEFLDDSTHKLKGQTVELPPHPLWENPVPPGG